MSNDGESSGSKNLDRLLGKFDPMAVDLAVAGNGFLRAGLDHMHKHSWAKGAWVQPALANMAIGIELMCKSYLAAANPLLIFNKVDADIAWAVHKPGFRFDEIPYERIHTLMEAGGSKTIGLSGCIELLQTRFPKKVQSLGPKQASLKHDRSCRCFSRLLAIFAALFCTHWTTIHIEDRLLPFVLYLFTLPVCLRCAPFSLFSFAPANRDIADALGHENLSSRIWSNVEKNVSRCLL